MPTPRASLGSHLLIELLDSSGRSEQMEVTLVPDHLADFSRGLLSESTPLAKTLLDQPAGTLLAYNVGDLKAVRILSITAGDMDEAASSAERRQKEIEKTRRDIDRQNAANFAASFSGKWGDYDPDGLANWDNDPSKKDSDDKNSP